MNISQMEVHQTDVSLFLFSSEWHLATKTHSLQSIQASSCFKDLFLIPLGELFSSKVQLPTQVQAGEGLGVVVSTALVALQSASRHLYK